MENRKSGFYWVMFDNSSGWQVAQYYEHLKYWYITGSDINCYDSEFNEIDERQIIRQSETPVMLERTFSMLESGANVNNPNLRDNQIILNSGVNDITKPMGHDMNPLQRNFMDSTH